MHAGLRGKFTRLRGKLRGKLGEHRGELDAVLAAREELVDDDDECDDDNEEREEIYYEKGTAANDVFIVAGQQLRYGSKAAWRVGSR